MHESVERIVESSDALREQQARDDEAGKLTDATLKILQHSGGLRLLQPKSLGGYEESPLVFGERVLLARPVSEAGDLRRDIMHPMFKELFIDTDADDLAAEQDRRHRAHRSRRARQAMIIRPAARNRQNPPRP